MHRCTNGEAPCARTPTRLAMWPLAIILFWVVLHSDSRVPDFMPLLPRKEVRRPVPGPASGATHANSGVAAACIPPAEREGRMQAQLEEQEVTANRVL